MATFIMLINITNEGIKGIAKGGQDRKAMFEKLVSDFGGEIKSSYLTMGSYDRVIVLDFPDDESAAKCALSIGTRGNARSITLRAFSGEEIKAIIDGIL